MELLIRIFHTPKRRVRARGLQERGGPLVGRVPSRGAVSAFPAACEISGLRPSNHGRAQGQLRLTPLPRARGGAAEEAENFVEAWQRRGERHRESALELCRWLLGVTAEQSLKAEHKIRGISPVTPGADSRKQGARAGRLLHSRGSASRKLRRRRPCSTAGSAPGPASVRIATAHITGWNLFRVDRGFFWAVTQGRTAAPESPAAVQPWAGGPNPFRIVRTACPRLQADAGADSSFSLFASVKSNAQQLGSIGPPGSSTARGRQSPGRTGPTAAPSSAAGCSRHRAGW